MPLFSDLDTYLKLGKGMEHIYQYNKDELMEVIEEAGFIVVKYDKSVGGNHNLILKKGVS